MGSNLAIKLEQLGVTIDQTSGWQQNVDSGSDMQDICWQVQCCGVSILLLLNAIYPDGPVLLENFELIFYTSKTTVQLTSHSATSI